MKKITCLTILILSCFCINAQEVVATQGASYSTASGSIDFTIGEVMIASVETGGEILTQGFHQPNFIMNALEHPKEMLDINYYPNPVQEELILELEKINGNNYIEVINLQGKIILTQTIRQVQNAINFSSFPSGLYFMTIKNEQQELLKTLKIQKIK